MKYPIYNLFAYYILFFIDWVLKRFSFSKKNFSIPLPQNILLSNVAHLGDVILTTALIPVLKKAFPNAKIGMLVGSWSLPVIKNHPLIQQMHIIDHWKINRNQHFFFKLYHYLSSRKKVKQQIKKINYDLAIDCNFHFPNMAYLLWRAQIPVRIGFESAGFAAFLTHSNAYQPENRPVVETLFSLLKHLNLETYREHLHPCLNIKEAKQRQDYIIIHMGSGNTNRLWLNSKWRALVECLIEEGETIFFTGKGVEENKAIESVMHGLPRASNLCNQLSWQKFAEFIQKAALLISVETSVGHLAAAVKTPAVLIYTGIHHPKAWVPFGGKTQVITHSVSCSPCFQGCQTMECVRSIRVTKVYQAVRSIKPLFEKRR